MTENQNKPKFGNNLLWEFKAENIICGIRASPTYPQGLQCPTTFAYRFVPMEENLKTRVYR